MAHADNSINTGKFKGGLGKQLVFRERAGKTVVAKSPKSRTGDPTCAGLITGNPFKLCVITVSGTTNPALGIKSFPILLKLVAYQSSTKWAWNLVL